MTEPKDDAGGRRRMLRVLVGAGSAAFGCAVAAPALLFDAAPAREGATGAGWWVRTLRLDALEEGQPKKVAVVGDVRDAWTVMTNVQMGAAWLVRRGAQVTAFNVTCPHLGCAVNAQPDRTFTCPCHTSAFDATGKRTGGPSPRDMDPLETRIEEGFVLVNFRRYRIGTADRVEVG